jgi:hypothetical protein
VRHNSLLRFLAVRARFVIFDDLFGKISKRFWLRLGYAVLNDVEKSIKLQSKGKLILNQYELDDPF